MSIGPTNEQKQEHLLTQTYRSNEKNTQRLSEKTEIERETRPVHTHTNRIESSNIPRTYSNTN